MDYTLVWALAARMGLPTFMATLAGLLVGGAVNFAANRGLVFQNAREAAAAKQAVRFAMLTSSLFLAHALSVTFARDVIGFSLLVAKMAADICYFGPGYPFLLRWLVFRP